MAEREPGMTLSKLFGNSKELKSLIIKNGPNPTVHASHWPDNESRWHCLREGIAFNTHLKEILFSNRCNNLSSISTKLIAQGLIDNTNIDSLYLEDCGIASYYVTQQVLDLFKYRKTGFRLISLTRVNTSDKFLARVIMALKENYQMIMSLQVLELSSINILGDDTINSCAKLISSSFVLKYLTIDESAMNNDRAIRLANAIKDNKNSKLECLRFKPGGKSCCITKPAWDAFEQALCDKTTIETTYASNHTLRFLGFWGKDYGAPPDLCTYLEWNQQGIGKEMKIVNYHFLGHGQANARPIGYQQLESHLHDNFSNLPVGLIPYLLVWLTKNDNHCNSRVFHAMLHQIIKTYPYMLDGDGGRESTNQQLRMKRHSTEFRLTSGWESQTKKTRL